MNIRKEAAYGQPLSFGLIIVGAVIEGVNELEEREKQLPSWNRRGGPKGRGGSKAEMVLLDCNERMGRRVI